MSEIIKKLESEIESECSAVDTEKRYDEMLDEVYSFECVGGIFASMSPSRVLAEVDPTAYQCGKNDWLDGERDNLIEVGDNYYETDEVEKTKESFLDSLRDELKSLESELEDIDEDLVSDRADKEQEINEKEEEIREVEDHSF